MINEYLKEMVKNGASDLYLSVGHYPSFRISDDLVENESKVLEEKDLDIILKEVLQESKIKEFYRRPEINVSKTFADGSRFRFNIFRQQNKICIVVRRISLKIPTIQELGLPAEYEELIMKKKGLIVLASPSGSGKSTSMAAMVGHRNNNMKGHILTIEDPIEFVHQHAKSIVSQREVGTDTESFSAALKSVLRQRADLIVVGECRDKESIEQALRFAETGHLCITTIHANNTSQAIERVVSFFPEEDRKYVLFSLSSNLVAIFTQKLINKIDGGRALAIEKLINAGLIKNLIKENRIPEIKEAIEKNKHAGMQTIDQSLFELYVKGEITKKTAIDESENSSNLSLMISQTSEGNIGQPSSDNYFSSD